MHASFQDDPVVLLFSCFEECVNRVFEDEGLVARKYQMRRVQVDVRVIAQVTARVSE